MTTGYFKKFCSSIDDSEQCQGWADETERGDRTQESLYESLLDKYGEEAVAQAHVDAMKELDANTTTEQQPKATQAPASRDRRTFVAQEKHIQQAHATQPNTRTVAQIPTVSKDAIMQKVQELQRKKEEERKKEEAREREIKNEQRAKEGISTPKLPPPTQDKGNIPAAPSNLKDICRVCVTPPTIAILEVLKLWYRGADAKFIEDIVDKVGTEDILLEEALAQIFIKDPNSLDGIERTLQDFNEVLAEALRIAAKRSPELRERFDKERVELEGVDEEAPGSEDVEAVSG